MGASGCPPSVFGLRALARIIMTVRREIAQSRCETGTRSPERPTHT